MPIDSTVIEHLKIKQGADFARAWPITDQDTGEPMDLQGATAKAQVRRDGVLLADLAPTINADAHQIEINVTADASAAWTWTFGLFDLFLTTSDGATYAIVEGNVELIPAVSHA